MFKTKTLRNGIGSFARVPQVLADWDYSAPWSLDTTAGETLFYDLAHEIGSELGYDSQQIEAVANRVASRIGDGLFTEATARTALLRAFNP